MKNHYDSGPVFFRRIGNGFFCLAFAVAAIIASVTPSASLSVKGAVCPLSSPKLIPAKAAIVVNSSGSVIYAKNQDAKLPPASTTKLITAMVALDRLSPDARLKINRSAAKTHSIRPRLRVNEELTVSNLLHLALMKSVNAAAVALAEGAAGSEKEFVELMNQKALAIGAVNTRFANASGLPEGLQYTTVYDLTLILTEALKYPIIREILGKKESVIVTPGGRSLHLTSTDRLLWATDNIIGGKTGYTRSAQHCFVGAFQTTEGPIFTAVLGTKSRNSMWKSTEFLYSLSSGPQSIPAIRQVNAGAPLVASNNEVGPSMAKDIIIEGPAKSGESSEDRAIGLAIKY